MRGWLAVVLVALAALAGCRGDDWPDAPTPYEPTVMALLPPAEVGPALASAEPARDRTELGPEATLADYQRHAALHSPELQAAFSRWRAALAEIDQAGALPDPRFTYRYYIHEIETRTGPQEQSFELAQTFPWFGKLALREDRAAQLSEAARHRLELARLDLAERVARAWYEYHYLARAIAITRENLELLTYLEEVARARYRVGAAQHPDVIRAQVEQGRLADRLRALEQLRGPVSARLNAALNRPTEIELPWPPPGELPDAELAVADEQVLAWLDESNPRLAALNAEAAAAGTAIDLAKKDYYPDVTLGLNYIDTGQARRPRPRDSGDDPLIAMASVNLPIWRDRLDAAVRQARMRRLATVADRTALANALRAELAMVLYDLRDARRKVSLYRDTLMPMARQSLQATEAAFRAGSASFTDLVDAQRVLLEFSLELQRALADAAGSHATVQRLVGRAVPMQPVIPPAEPTTMPAQR